MSWNAVTGDDVTIAGGGYEAAVSSVGASLRSLTFGGRNLVAPFSAGRVRPVFRGATLLPWPNRVANGRYDFEGETFQLALTETDRGNALHGLVAWADWALESASAERVALTAQVVPTDGYPSRLASRMEYAVGNDGLTGTLTSTNIGERSAPYGASAHPYLTPGSGEMADWTLTVPADTVLEVDPERLLPTGLAPLDAHPELDFRRGRTIGETRIDHAFTGIARDDGVAEVRLSAPDGATVRMRWGGGMSWVQVHTADRPEPELNRSGLAVEPMTCPPDAFNSGTDLIVLQPGDSSTTSWTISA